MAAIIPGRGNRVDCRVVLDRVARAPPVFFLSVFAPPPYRPRVGNGADPIASTGVPGKNTGRARATQPNDSSTSLHRPRRVLSITHRLCPGVLAPPPDRPWVGNGADPIASTGVPGKNTGRARATQPNDSSTSLHRPRRVLSITHCLCPGVLAPPPDRPRVGNGADPIASTGVPGKNTGRARATQQEHSAKRLCHNLGQDAARFDTGQAYVRPWNLNVSRSWSMPSRCRSVAWKS